MGTQLPWKKHTPHSLPQLNFWPMSIVAKGLDGSRCHLVRRKTSAQATLCCVGWVAALPLKGIQPQFSAHVYCGQMAEWMKTPLGTEVDLGPGHIVLDEDPAPPPAKEAQQPPLFGPCLLWPLSPISATTELLLLKVRYRPLSPFTRCLLHYCASTKAGSSSNTMWPGSRPIPPCQIHLDPSNRLATIHRCYRQTDRQTDTQADRTTGR